MKKLFTVSVLAIMAVSTANAEIASTQYVGNRTGDLQFTGQAEGKTDLTAAVNAIADAVGDTNVGTQIQSALTDGKYVKEGDSLSVLDNTATGFVNAGGAVDAVQQAGYAKTADVVTDAELAVLTGTKDAAAGQVVTGVTTTGGVVTAVSGSKITNDFIEDGTISQAKIDGLANTFSGKQDKLGSSHINDTGDGNVITGISAENGVLTVTKGKTLGGAAEKNVSAKVTSGDANLVTGDAVATAIATANQQLGLDKQDVLTPGDYVNIDENNVITTTYIGTDTVAITKNAEGKGELSVQEGSIGAAQLSETVDADIAKGVAAHTAVTIPTITDGNPDGMYALTAKVVGGVVSGYSWEAIGR